MAGPRETNASGKGLGTDVERSVAPGLALVLWPGLVADRPDLFVLLFSNRFATVPQCAALRAGSAASRSRQRAFRPERVDACLHAWGASDPPSSPSPLPGGRR